MTNDKIEDVVLVWLEEARTKVIPGTRAEKATDLIDVLYTAVQRFSLCEKCTTCSVDTEAVIEQCADIVEEI